MWYWKIKSKKSVLLQWMRFSFAPISKHCIAARETQNWSMSFSYWCISDIRKFCPQENALHFAQKTRPFWLFRKISCGTEKSNLKSRFCSNGWDFHLLPSPNIVLQPAKLKTDQCHLVNDVYRIFGNFVLRTPLPQITNSLGQIISLKRLHRKFSKII